MNTCKNCHHEFEGNFCPQCGQRVITKRLTIGIALSNFISTFFNLERGFIYTIKMMFVNPSQVIRDYISGSTVKYTNPFRFILVLATISTLISVSSGFYEETTLEVNKWMGGMSDMDASELESQKAYQEKVMVIMKKYLSFVLIMLIPFFSLASYWIIRKKLNYTEHFILNTYTLGQATLIGIPITFLFLLFPSLISSVTLLPSIIMVLYFAYVFRSMFNTNYILGVLISIVCFIIAYILMMLLIMLISIPIMIVKGGVA